MRRPRSLRLAQLVLDLAPGPSRTVEELALAYGVSRRTVLRDMQELKRFRIDIREDEGFLVLEPSAYERIREWMGVSPPSRPVDSADGGPM